MHNQSNSTPPSQSLLTEASETSLEELMNRTPDINDEEADRIIEYLRAQREKFAMQEAAPKPKKSPRKRGPILSADDILGAIE